MVDIAKDGNVALFRVKERKDTEKIFALRENVGCSKSKRKRTTRRH